MTIYDIAKKAGVSASTVSRVVNNRNGIKESTKKKILALLDEYNFSLNETARGLVTHNSKIIGILISDIRNIHYVDSAYFIEREFTKQGYCTIIFNTGTDNQSRVTYIKMLASRRVDGAILVGSTFQNDVIKEAISTYLPTTPVVIENGYIDLPNVYGVLADEYGGIKECVRLLKNKGFSHMVFFIDQYTPSNTLKLQGYIDALGEKNPLVVQCENTLKASYVATAKLMDEHPETDSIIYCVDLMAAGGVRALTDRGIRIPETIGIIGVDNSVYSEISNPTLTSLDNKLVELSLTSSKMLSEAIKGQYTSKKVMIFSTIVEREST
ncbi:MAG: LacI family DNA-binding transcriptional regulator [Sphaerochaetaceae bacterium]